MSTVHAAPTPATGACCPPTAPSRGTRHRSGRAARSGYERDVTGSRMGLFIGTPDAIATQLGESAYVPTDQRLPRTATSAALLSASKSMPTLRRLPSKTKIGHDRWAPGGPTLGGGGSLQSQVWRK